jgi:cytochrome P450 family 135
MEGCQGRYGDAFTLNVRASQPWVFVSDPDDVKQLFTTDPRLLRVAAAEANPLLGPLLGPRSVTLLEEPDHMRDRKGILPAFHGEYLQEWERVIVDVAEQHVLAWPQGQPFALWPRMQVISREVLLRAVFSDSGTERMRHLRAALAALTAWVNNSNRLKLLAAFGPRTVTIGGKFHRLRRAVEELVLDEVRERRRRLDIAGRRDILSLLEHAYVRDGVPVAEDKLCDELLTLLSDGPTATSLAWAFERLLQQPDQLARLVDETICGGWEYADAIVKETLRLCPTVPVAMRLVTESLAIGPYAIPAGTMVAACIYLTHLRPDVYPAPRSFRPERFLEIPPGTYTWIPFGGGARRCIAASFSVLEMRLVLQTVVRSVELHASGSTPSAPARSAVSFAPDGGARVVVTARATAG